jgi:hypothetical protein
MTSICLAQHGEIADGAHGAAESLRRRTGPTQVEEDEPEQDPQGLGGARGREDCSQQHADGRERQCDHNEPDQNHRKWNPGRRNREWGWQLPRERSPRLRAITGVTMIWAPTMVHAGTPDARYRISTPLPGRTRCGWGD